MKILCIKDITHIQTLEELKKIYNLTDICFSYSVDIASEYFDLTTIYREKKLERITNVKESEI